jgi:hypothetical protein
MKHLKMLGLAVVAAAALMAFLGAGTASATKLCDPNNQTTNCTTALGSGTVLKFSAEDSIKLLGPFSIIIDTCTGSTVEGPTTTAGGGEGVPVKGEVKTLTFTSCTRPTTVGSGGTMEISSISGTDNGSVKSSGATVTVHEVPNIIGNPPTCAYTTSGTSLGTLTGSLTGATFDINATINSETSGCPSGTWSGHYKSTGTNFVVSAS